MTKYYFGYNKFNGQVFPVKWMEEDDKPIGGKPNRVMQQTEITNLQFNVSSLSVLEALHPLKGETEEGDKKV